MPPEKPMPERALQRIEETVDKLEAVSAQLASARNWIKILGAAVVLIAVVSVLAGYVTFHDYQFRKCMQQWAADFTSRTEALTSLDRGLRASELERVGAVDRLLVDQSQQPPAPPPVLFQDYRALLKATADFEAATKRYTRVIATVPIPEAPKCGALY